ncbi:hypothetical protein E1264_00290 [Actinomadura sp. KC216]|uniref:hypothetical protein n=1 Tax=Actinomadura sp. KC216 TaxID=2530370 RepID=UPI00104393BD|nr:hypothetical protein [Actinomadura sp. KC216]TDB91942.1 hypothetical protein E1264_00290 [Actinomadura sp. KC216]
MESSQVEAGLAYVCANFGEIRALLEDEGAGETMPLSQLKAALQDRQKPDRQGPSREHVPELLNAVHLAVQARGDVLGVFGYGGFRSVMGADGVESLEIVYRCPLKACAGRDEAEVSEFPPRCSISGVALVREPLDP